MKKTFCNKIEFAEAWTVDAIDTDVVLESGFEFKKLVSQNDSISYSCEMKDLNENQYEEHIIQITDMDVVQGIMANMMSNKHYIVKVYHTDGFIILGTINPYNPCRLKVNSSLQTSTYTFTWLKAA